MGLDRSTCLKLWKKIDKIEQPEFAYLHVPITASKISFNIITDIMISEVPLS